MMLVHGFEVIHIRLKIIKWYQDRLSVTSAQREIVLKNGVIDGSKTKKQMQRKTRLHKPPCRCTA